jgi:hypothetical protein
MTITIALATGRLAAGLIVLMLVTPVQFVSYAVRFWKVRYKP